MLSGAQRMVTWATEAIIAPHAEHSDPTEHPQCLMCRGSLILGDSGLSGLWSLAGLLSGHEADERDGGGPVGGSAGGPAGGPREAGLAFDSPEPAEPIRWIPVRDEVP